MSVEGRRVGVLDELRGITALYVAVAHVLLHQVGYFSTGAARIPWVFAQEAVMIFFLISGAAIRISTIQRGGVVDGVFLGRRFLRLYPTLVLGLLLGYVGASAAQGYWVDPQWGKLVSNLLFLQDFAPVKPGTISSTYYGNATLWSLSYEWWFYVLFYLVWRHVKAASRVHFAGVLSVVALLIGIWQPNAASYWAGYFILWWAGGSLVEPQRAEQIKAFGWVLAAVVVVIAGAVLNGDLTTDPARAGVYPWLLVRHFGFVAGVLGVVLCLRRWQGQLSNLRLGFGWLAPYSYALYVLHYPLVADAHWLPWFGVAAPIPTVVIYAATAVVATWWCERHYQAAVVRWLSPRLLKRQA